jgi:hypothetical protein
MRSRRCSPKCNPFTPQPWRHQAARFYEHGIAMLSSVLSSDQAIEVHLMIPRTFAGCGNCSRRTRTWRCGWIHSNGGGTNKKADAGYVRSPATAERSAHSARTVLAGTRTPDRLPGSGGGPRKGPSLARRPMKFSRRIQPDEFRSPRSMGRPSRVPRLRWLTAAILPNQEAR